MSGHQRKTSDDEHVAVYGSAEQMAMLFASIADLTEREPDDTFQDDTVRTAARSLAATLHCRLAGTSRS
jgi:hypothetical protein